MQEDGRILPLGDGTLVIQFGNRIDDNLHAKVMQFYQRLQQAAPFIIDVIPAYCSLTVCYDVLQLHSNEKTAFEKVKEFLLPMLEETAAVQPLPGREVRIPVCYASEFALDLEELSKSRQLSPEEIIHLHSSRSYRVYMIGFLPGFPYMGTVDDRIAMPRKSSPRKSIPAGSVGIAGIQTGIYPFDSPGGWNIIGRTPLKLFDKNKEEPVLLQPGDTVTFYSITEDEFRDYQSRTA